MRLFVILGSGGDAAEWCKANAGDGKLGAIWAIYEIAWFFVNGLRTILRATGRHGKNLARKRAKSSPFLSEVV